MSKIKLLIVIFLGVLLVGCGAKTESAVLEINVGEVVIPDFQEYIDTNDYTLVSKDDTVIIEGNSITGVKPGTATVNVVVGDDTKVIVTVTITAKEFDVKIDKDITISKPTTLDVEFINCVLDDFTILYDDSICQVDGLTLTPLKDGTFKLTLKHKETGLEFISNITIVTKSINITNQAKDVLINDSLTLDIELLGCTINDVQIVATNCIVDLNTVTFNNEGVATIKVVLKDDATIFDTITVNVIKVNIKAEPISLYQNETKDLNIEFIASSIDDYNITYDETKLSVANGEVTGLMTGTHTITYQHKEYQSLLYVQTIIVIEEAMKIEILNTNTITYVNSTVTLELDLTSLNASDLTISASNCQVDGLNITFLKEGITTVTVMATNNVEVSDMITFEVLKALEPSIKITNEEKEIMVLEQLPLLFVLSVVTEDELIIESSDPSVLLVEGKIVKAVAAGRARITVTWSKDDTVKARLNLTVSVDPFAILDPLHIENPLVKYVSTYGYNPSIRYQWVMGSVNLYLFDVNKVIEQIVPITNNQYVGKTATQAMLKEAETMNLVRSGILHEKTQYITYHDTGNHTPGANAAMHANYMVSADNVNNRARSWHYTVDEKQIYHHIPDNEVSWQGDSYDAYAKSIGIETCVDFGSDLYIVWQRTAKLMATLMAKHGLTIDDVKQHYDFSRKNCPQTLRMNNLYSHALEMIAAEVMVRKHLSSYKIVFESLNPEYVDNRGRVINLPSTATTIQYKITVTHTNGFNQSKVYSSTLQPLPQSNLSFNSNLPLMEQILEDGTKVEQIANFNAKNGKL